MEEICSREGTIPLGGYVPLNTGAWERMELMKHYNGVPFLRTFFGIETEVQARVVKAEPYELPDFTLSHELKIYGLSNLAQST